MALLSLPEDMLGCIVNSSCRRPEAMSQSAHMAAISSDMLISDDFAFWLQCEKATAKVRYWEICRKLPRTRLGF